MTIDNLHQVTPHLYTAGRVRLKDAPELAAMGIRSVLNTTLTADPINFVLNALKSGKVLIHCEAGVNRSPSMAYAVLRAQGMSEQAAAELVMKKCRIDRIRYAPDAEKALAK